MSGQTTTVLSQELEENTRNGPSTPVLGSTIFKQQAALCSSHSSAESALGSHERRYLSTSIPTLDSSVLISGGFAYGGSAPGSSPGEVVSLAFEDGPRSAVSNAFLHYLLAAHLVPLTSSSAASSAGAASNPGCAFYVDTTGDFSVRLLYDVLLQRLQLRRRPQSENNKFTHNGGYVYSRAEHEEIKVESDKQLEEEAGKLLDKVSCMRVLDFIGIMEAIGEIQEKLGHCSKIFDSPEDAKLYDLETRTTVADSQRDPDEDDDMLDWPANAAPQELLEISPKLYTLADASGAAGEALPFMTEAQSNTTGPPLIILSSLNQHLTPEMYSSHIHAHALLVHLMRSLRGLCQAPLGACVVITNAAVSVSAQGSNVRRDASDGDEIGTSAFASKAHLRPALGRTYAQLVDLSLMITLWKRENNVHVAEVLEDARGVNTAANKHRLSMTCESRVGKWTVFSIANGTLQETCNG